MLRNSEPPLALHGIDLFGDPIKPMQAPLAERFLVPPFSVLDARQGFWQERKRGWLVLGIESEIGRGDNSLGPAPASNFQRKTHKSDNLLGFSEVTAIGGNRQLAKSKLGREGNLLGMPSAANRQMTDGSAYPRGKAAKLAKAYGDASNCQLEAKQKSKFGKNIGRGENLLGMLAVGGSPERLLENYGKKAMIGTSIFDPVLCELMYTWFCPESGTVLDPFAGGSVRGLVASKLGLHYAGVDLSPTQVKANRKQALTIHGAHMPKWYVGDSASGLPKVEADMILSCPPYGALERYSDSPQDLSTMEWPQFQAAYQKIISRAAARLKPNRFACFVVGVYRDKSGFYCDLVGETVRVFTKAGLRFYNDAVLITAIGSLPIRSTRFASSRKLGKTHQNVLVFVKGDWKKAALACKQDVLPEGADENGEAT